MEFKEILILLEQQGMKLLGGIVVLIAGFVAVHWLLKLMRKGGRFGKVDETVRTFLESLARIVLYAIVVLTAANVMGIPLTSFVTIIASAGVAISLALQGVLSNFIGGILILVLKQIKAGEYVKVGDVEGTVRGIGVFYTELVTFDNRHVSMPNSSLTNTSIINFSREGTRRVDLEFSVSYESDIERVKQVLMDVVKDNSKVMEAPSPETHLLRCADSSLGFTVRVWCASADYWTVYFDLIERGKRALDEAGIEIPYPQMDVHMK